MTIKIYLSNLARYIDGRENGRWLNLPMEKEKLQTIYNEIIGAGQEHIILDYSAPFQIEEYENVFDLNEYIKNLFDLGIDIDILTALFNANHERKDVLAGIESGDFDIINVGEVSFGWSTGFDRNTLYGMVLNAEGYNNLFSQPIPEEMVDYINFSQIFICLSVNDGWTPVEVGETTYLVRI